LLTLFLISFCSILATGQDHYIFKGGAAVPLGDYGAKENDNSGYANGGFNFAFENKTFLNENFSLGFYISYVQNGLDTDQLADNSFGNNPAVVSASIDADPYKALLVMVGPQYTISVGNYGGLSLKGGIGAFTSFLGPLQLNAVVRDPLTGATAAVRESFALQGKLAFSFYVGADFHYFLSDTFGLVGYLDYSLANPNFEVESVSGLDAEISQQMQFLNVGAGIVLRR